MPEPHTSYWHFRKAEELLETTRVEEAKVHAILATCHLVHMKRYDGGTPPWIIDTEDEEWMFF